jgi:hypothetical protein
MWFKSQEYTYDNGNGSYIREGSLLLFSYKYSGDPIPFRLPAGLQYKMETLRLTHTYTDYIMGQIEVEGWASNVLLEKKHFEVTFVDRSVGLYLAYEIVSENGEYLIKDSNGGIHTRFPMANVLKIELT